MPRTVIRGARYPGDIAFEDGIITEVGIVDPKDNYSDIRVIGFYKGDHYYKDGEKMIYRISHKNNSPIYFDSGEFKVHSEYEDFPLVRVSWFGAHNYCSYYGFKLPPTWLWIKAAKEPEFILKNHNLAEELGIDNNFIDSVLKEGAEKANTIAQKKVKEMLIDLERN